MAICAVDAITYACKLPEEDQKDGPKSDPDDGGVKRTNRGIGGENDASALFL